MLQLTVPCSRSQSIVHVTLLLELQKGQLNAESNFGRTFLGGGFEDFRLPILTEILRPTGTVSVMYHDSHLRCKEFRR